MNPDNFCTNMKIYLFFIILDISQLQSTVVLGVVVSIESAFIFSCMTVSQDKLHFILRTYRYSRHTKEVNPFVNMYKEDFGNIQLKQRPFPFIERFSLSSL